MPTPKSKRCTIASAADLMTEIMDYQIKVEEQRLEIVNLKAELAKKSNQLKQLQTAVNEYMKAQNELPRTTRHSSKLMLANK